MSCEEITELNANFSINSSVGKEIDLSTEESVLTVDNRNDYISSAIKFRLHEYDATIDEIRCGISKVVPLPLLSLFTCNELETMVCGSREISVDLLKSVATCKDSNCQVFRWLWQVLEEFTEEEKSLFLRFVWGRSRLPRTIQDFRGRDFVIQILDKFDPPDYHLPESYTCFFMLKLPKYSSKYVLREKLSYAIHFCKSIDTDDYARFDTGGANTLQSSNQRQSFNPILEVLAPQFF